MSKQEGPPLSPEELEATVNQLSLLPGVAGRQAREEALSIAAALRQREIIRSQRAHLDSRTFDAVEAAIDQLHHQGFLPAKPTILLEAIADSRRILATSSEALTPESLGEALRRQYQERIAQRQYANQQIRLADMQREEYERHRVELKKIRAIAEIQYIHDIGLVDLFVDAAREITNSGFKDAEIHIRSKREHYDNAIDMYWGFGSPIWHIWKKYGRCHSVGARAISSDHPIEGFTTNFIGIGFRLKSVRPITAFEVIAPRRDVLATELGQCIIEADDCSGGRPNLIARFRTWQMMRAPGK